MRTPRLPARAPRVAQSHCGGVIVDCGLRQHAVLAHLHLLAEDTVNGMGEVRLDAGGVPGACGCIDRPRVTKQEVRLPRARTARSPQSDGASAMAPAV